MEPAFIYLDKGKEADISQWKVFKTGRLLKHKANPFDKGLALYGPALFSLQIHLLAFSWYIYCSHLTAGFCPVWIA